MSAVAGIVLAAGESLRMGFPKPFLPFRGGTYLEAVAGGLLAAACDPIIVVANPAHEARYKGLNLDARVRVFYNQRVSDGMYGSLKLGLGLLAADSEGALVQLVDAPGVAVQSMLSVAAGLRRNPTVFSVAAHGGLPGHPVGIPAMLYPMVMSWDGPGGLRGLMDAHSGASILVETGDPAVLLDADTPEGHAAMLRRAQSGPATDSGLARP